jgi:REP element-mobilizing transposase RayT
MDAPLAPQEESAGSRALRRGRWSEPGRIYLVTTITRDRRPWFADPELAAAAARQTLLPSCALDARLQCWILMPDHLHALVELGPAHTLPRVVQHLKSSIAAAVNRAAGRSGPLWEKGFHDRALRADEDLRGTARYLIGNPIRAGLVSRAGDYPYWNAIWL